MLALAAIGSVFFPGLFLLTKHSLRRLIGWSEGDAAVVSTRLLSSLQAIMASSVGCIIISSCSDVMEDRHWLTERYIFFATPYFAYDIYAMFLCYRHKLHVKGHEEADEIGTTIFGFLRREFLMVLHHVFMVTFCFPTSVSPGKKTNIYINKYILGCPLDSVEDVSERRMLAKITSILDNSSQPLDCTVEELSSSSSGQLRPPQD